MNDKAESVERFVLYRLVEQGEIPSREEIIEHTGASDSELADIDSRHEVLKSLWNFSEKELTVLRELSIKEPKPRDFQGLLYLVAQIELKVAADNLRKQA